MLPELKQLVLHTGETEPSVPEDSLMLVMLNNLLVKKLQLLVLMVNLHVTNAHVILVMMKMIAQLLISSSMSMTDLMN